MKLKLSILALFILVAISVKGAVVDTLAVYSEAMKKNVQVVVVSPENNHVPKPVVYLLHGYGGNGTARKIRPTVMRHSFPPN